MGHFGRQGQRLSPVVQGVTRTLRPSLPLGTAALMTLPGTVWDLP